MNSDEYRQQIEAWRQKLDDSLRAEDSWLALAGLYWLDEGRNSIGTDPSGGIVLPPGSGTTHLGDILLVGDQASLLIRGETALTVDGEQVQEVVLKPDVSGSPSEIRLGELTMMLLKRGERYAIRLWDNGRSERKDFQGRRWYPIEESYRLMARFSRYEPVKRISFPNELGEIEENDVLGYVRFVLHGQECRLDVMETGGGGLFIIFKDETSGKETYPPGRYLVTRPPEDGEVVVDFNRAYNPPCAFTPYATCTLPPPQNHLSLEVKSGERYR